MIGEQAVDGDTNGLGRSSFDDEANCLHHRSAAGNDVIDENRRLSFKAVEIPQVNLNVPVSSTHLLQDRIGRTGISCDSRHPLLAFAVRPDDERSLYVVPDPILISAALREMTRVGIV